MNEIGIAQPKFVKYIHELRESHFLSTNLCNKVFTVRKHCAGILEQANILFKAKLFDLPKYTQNGANSFKTS